MAYLGAATGRTLNDYEVFDFLAKHPDIAGKVALHEATFGYAGRETWNQILIAAQGDADQYGVPVPIPPRGIAAQDEIYGYVIVYPDASGILHFSATDNTSLVQEIQKPVYHSDPEYWQLYEDIAKRLAAGVQPTINLGLGAVAGVAVLAIILLLAPRR